MEYSINDAIEMAKRMNAAVASVKDWRLNRKVDRAMKEAAAKLNEGKGYILATPSELGAMYSAFVGGNHVPGSDDENKAIWAFFHTTPDKHGRERVYLAAVHVFGK